MNEEEKSAEQLAEEVTAALAAETNPATAPKTEPKREVATETDEQGREYKKSLLPRLRTYETDVIDAGRGGLNMAEVAVKEQEKRQEEEVRAAEEEARPENIAKRERRRKLVFISVIVVVILASLSVVGYFVYKSRQAPPVIATRVEHAEPLIFAEESHSIDLTNREPLNAVREVANYIASKNLRLGSLEHVYYTERQEELGEPVLSVLTFDEFVSALGLSVPERLKRLIDGRFMHGIYSGASTKAFLILRTSTYSSTFSEMLDWENTMAEDLYPILVGRDAAREEIFETITPPVRRTWADEVIKNIDVRVLRGGDGEVLLSYAFAPESEVFIIAPSFDILAEMITRLQTPKPVVQ